MTFEDKLDNALNAIRNEVLRAKAKFPRVASGRHEAYAVLLEEVDELWDDIKGNAPLVAVQTEAVQVGAMAVRFLIEVEK